MRKAHGLDARRPVDRETVLLGKSGYLSVVNAAELGGYDFETFAWSVEDMVRRGTLRWTKDNCLVFAPRSVK